MDSVRRSSVLLAVIGPDWATAADRDGRRQLDDEQDWVRREITEAFAHDIPVLPLLVNDAPRLDPADLPGPIARLARCQYLRLHYRNVPYDVHRLVDELRQLAPELRGLADESDRSLRLRRSAYRLVLAAAVLGLVSGLTQLDLWLLPPGGTASPSNVSVPDVNRVTTGDWDGNGTMTPGVVRKAEKGNWDWQLRNSNEEGSVDVRVGYGRAAIDTPVVGDWDGNGTMTPGVVRRNDDGNWTWLLHNKIADGPAEISFSYGDVSG